MFANAPGEWSISGRAFSIFHARERDIQTTSQLWVLYRSGNDPGLLLVSADVRADVLYCFFGKRRD